MPPPGWNPDPAWPPPPPGWIWYRSASRPKWLITAGIVVGLGLAGTGAAYIQGQDEADRAPQVGECAHKVGPDEIQRVDCSDADADFRVTSRQEGTSDGDSVCAKDTVATTIYEFDARSHGVSLKSFVLCMVEN